MDVLHCSIILIPIWTEHSAVLLCHFDVYSTIISKLIVAKFSLTSHLSYNRQTFGILLNNCLCIMVLISICHCLVRVYARVCVRVSVCECFFSVCLFCMPCVERVWMFFVLLFYVIYSRTIASLANVFCWLYPTLNKVYLILSYLNHRSTHSISLLRVRSIHMLPLLWLCYTATQTFPRGYGASDSCVS